MQDIERRRPRRVHKITSRGSQAHRPTGRHGQAYTRHGDDRLPIRGGGGREWRRGRGGGLEGGRGGALELPSWVDDACGSEGGMRDDLEDLRDAVSGIVDLFVSRLDSEGIVGVEGERDDEASGNAAVVGGGRRYRRMLEGTNHLEHFHVYAKDGGGGRLPPNHDGGDDEGNAVTLDYHTDAGFFLAFVPAMDCRTLTSDVESFFLSEIDGPVAFGDDEVIIMMGAGAQHWLPPSPSYPRGDERRFVAASHALRLGHGTRRAWYGKMHLLPQSYSTNGTVYGDGFGLGDHQDKHVLASPVDGCGTRVEEDVAVLDEDILQSAKAGNDDGTKSGRRRRRKSRRRLQHVSSPANCNNVTDFFCWHQCVGIPDADSAERYVRDGYSLYCLDPALLPSSSSANGDGVIPVSDATTPCRGGYVHNSDCVGSWQRTDDDVPGYELPYETREEASMATHSDGEYCYGGTSMYMDGFQWRGSTCIIYLFQSWTLSTPFKFAMAAFGSIVLGVSLEYVLRARRRVYALSPGTRRLVMSTAFYGLQLTMGYYIMLVIMTYSGPLFLCTVGGMMVGHALFNAQDSLAKRWTEKKNDGGTRRDGTEDVPEASGGGGGTGGGGGHTELGSYQNGKSLDIILQGGRKLKPPPEVDLEGSVSSNNSAAESTRLRRDIADGATPCCQYIVD